MIELQKLRKVDARGDSGIAGLDDDIRRLAAHEGTTLRALEGAVPA